MPAFMNGSEPLQPDPRVSNPADGTPRILPGLLAGLIATVPMTLEMILLQRNLPKRHKHKLPPVQITNRAIEKTNAGPGLKSSHLSGTALAAHFGFGAIAGACYNPLVPWRAPTLLKGMGFGLLVWAISYKKLLPGLNLYPPAHEEPKRMNGIMIVGHLIWGAVTAILAKRFDAAFPCRGA